MLMTSRRSMRPLALWTPDVWRNRLEMHYTPKHGSWLNMAEIELSVLKGQCLDRRIPDNGYDAGKIGRLAKRQE